MVPFYLFMIRPLRVLLNEHILVPIARMLYRGDLAVEPDIAGTGALMQHDESGLMVVMAFPFGQVFFGFLILLLLAASHSRFYVMLLALHLGAFIAALLAAAIAGHTSELILHLIPLFQQHLVLAASFAILFFSLKEHSSGSI